MVELSVMETIAAMWYIYGMNCNHYINVTLPVQTTFYILNDTSQFRVHSTANIQQLNCDYVSK